ncbi:MAG: hypothetical protein A3H27_07210 [Acidobacteria bacterium RIFCSPLOWO2_02_FULL_59_13]|nr:MAG: hypothetical protein A3H27_07210 [Acidobacteria bacterium RIFCSPLOWO2_02_FULL_59_13]
MPEEGNPNGEGKDNEPNARVELYIPPSVIDSYKAEQVKSHGLEKWKFTVEILTLLAIVAYAVIAYDQGCSMRQATEATQKAAGAAEQAAETASRQLEMADRPWIKEIVSSGAQFMIDRGAISWAVLVKAENVGNSVATGVFVEAKLIAMKDADYFDGPANAMNQFCDDIAKQSPINPKRWGVSIFPNDAGDLLGASPIMFPKEVEEAVLDGGATLGKSIFPMIIGCIDYQFATSSVRHQTRFIYDVIYRDPETGTNQPFVPIGKGSLPMEAMILYRHRVSGQFAY